MFHHISEGPTSKALMGGKAYYLAVMQQEGLPVPPAYYLSTEFFTHCLIAGGTKEQVDTKVVFDACRELIQPVIDGVKEGHLISIRSGAPISMPGMMDTILNVGICSETRPLLETAYGKPMVEKLEKKLLIMYADVVFGVELDAELSSLPVLHKDYREKVGLPFFDTVEEQIYNAVCAVMRSWFTPRAIQYREINNIPHDLGTAVIFQKMVFGNLDSDSCTGVYFSTDPNDGYGPGRGDYLINAQGEDVVDGSTSPETFSAAEGVGGCFFSGSTSKVVRDCLTQVTELAATMEQKHHDIQDIEFTVESGRLYLLQTRSAKRTDTAALEYINHHKQCGPTAFDHLSMNTFARLLKPVPNLTLSEAPKKTGIGIGGGFAVGYLSSTGGPGTVFFAKTTNPNDLDKMVTSEAILTTTGGFTCHAAVVARSLGLPAIVSMKVSLAWLSGHEGSPVVVDGTQGVIYLIDQTPESVEFVSPSVPSCIREFLKQTMKVTCSETSTYVAEFPVLDQPSSVGALFDLGLPVRVGGVAKATPYDVLKGVPQAFFDQSGVTPYELVELIKSKQAKNAVTSQDNDPLLLAQKFLDTISQ